jgi:hypothetical protein
MFFIERNQLKVMLGFYFFLLFIIGSGCIVNNPIQTTKSPLSTNDSTDYQTKTGLRLPFDGFWYVFSGGRHPSLNHHHYSVDQKYAYDFIIKINGMSFEGDDSQNEAYYCFGKPLYAPGSGTVVVLVDTVHDNTPVRKLNPNQPAGNYIVIDHDNGEYSFLAHFKKKSIIVKKGEKVIQGQLLGLCGNSGWSYEPHLHYHIQDTPWIFNGIGLPAQFQWYIKGSDVIERGEPIRGQYVENAKQICEAVQQSQEGSRQ